MKDEVFWILIGFVILAWYTGESATIGAMFCGFIIGYLTNQKYE